MHQREDAADHHAVADQPAELLQAREVDEHQAVERRRRRPHAEQHAARRPGDRRRHVGVGVARRAPGDARRTAARRRRRRGRTAWRPRRWRRPTASRRRTRSRRARRRSDRRDGSDPTATSQRLRKTMNSSGRISASEPTVFRMLSRLTTASVSTAMRWPPANWTRSGGRGSSSSLSSGGGGGRRWTRDRAQPRVERARELRVVRRTPRPRDHQPAAAVRASRSRRR